MRNRKGVALIRPRLHPLACEKGKVPQEWEMIGTGGGKKKNKKNRTTARPCVFVRSWADASHKSRFLTNFPTPLFLGGPLRSQVLRIVRRTLRGM
jgi:hypothetical protein